MNLRVLAGMGVLVLALGLSLLAVGLIGLWALLLWVPIIWGGVVGACRIIWGREEFARTARRD